MNLNSFRVSCFSWKKLTRSRESRSSSMDCWKTRRNCSNWI